MTTPDVLPDYHFLLIAPNLDARWLFVAARRYWKAFQPAVISDLELVRLVPPDRTVAVTVIARRDRAAQYGVDLARTREDALFDPVVHDFFEDAQTELDARAADNQPFGVPLRSTPTASPTATPSRTPGPAPTRAPGGFITQTPTPPGEELTPTPRDPNTPIFPTPGPIGGGDE
jgi:hypothetical protein